MLYTISTKKKLISSNLNKIKYKSIVVYSKTTTFAPKKRGKPQKFGTYDYKETKIFRLACSWAW